MNGAANLHQKWSVRDENQLVRTFNRNSSWIIGVCIALCIAWVCSWNHVQLVVNTISIAEVLSGFIGTVWRKSTVTTVHCYFYTAHRKNSRTERKYFNHVQLVRIHLTIRAFQICVYVRWIMGIASHIIQFPPIRYSIDSLLESEFIIVESNVSKEIRFFLYGWLLFLLSFNRYSILACASWVSSHFFY